MKPLRDIIILWERKFTIEVKVLRTITNVGTTFISIEKIAPEQNCPQDIHPKIGGRFADHQIVF
jgi:hypothetical protein